MTLPDLRKYPRTRHIEGSRLQPGDHDLTAVPFASLAGEHLVVEEKIDGANAALSFDGDGRLLLQSRGHYLTGGPREKHFALFKTWAACHQRAFQERLGDRYVVYGEWVYAKHTIFYDRLPHWFLEFDVLDRVEGSFLSTPARRELLDGLPISSVPVLREGPVPDLDSLWSLVRRSLYKSAAWRDSLRESADRSGGSTERSIKETDPEDNSEGLYIKVESRGTVQGRFKLVRPSFLTAVQDSGSHWLARPIVPNQLAPGVDIYAAAP